MWLKRDLRLRDHQPLCNAIALGNPIVIAYVIEPWQYLDGHIRTRHWRFIMQSIEDMQQELGKFNHQVTICQADIVKLLDAWSIAGLSHIFSHQEIGLAHSFLRDKEVLGFCNRSNINWQESPYGAVLRPLSNRLNWRKHWYGRIKEGVYDPDLSSLETLKLPKSQLAELPYQISNKALPSKWFTEHKRFQKGGEKLAWYTLHDFFKERGKHYFGNIGKPERARHTCSRLSPYLAWGNISIKQAFQVARQNRNRDGWARSVEALCSRLSWHCHFIQKFESEHEIEHRPVNHAYQAFEYDNSHASETMLDAWKTGNTGIPIIDASMRALIQTGYLNFRMRAMLVSFLCHHLNIDWKRGVTHLGSLFLDFEPGIHYPQFQMQAGITGTNTIRIYNPIKQSEDKDPEGIFIKKWVPELSNVPKEYIHEVHLIPPIEAQLIDFDVEKDYVLPIVDVNERAKLARDRLWQFRKRMDVKAEAKRILKAHTVPN